MAGQTFNMSYRGTRLTVAQGQDDTIEFRVGDHRQTPKAKTFKPAVREAVTWLFENAGKIDESRYER
jgi:hypothetical protein